MLATVHTAALRGVESYPVRVEVSFTSGLPSFAILGLAQGAAKESRDRVVAALRHAGHALPPRRVTVNLAPAGIRKGGAHFDLPLALALLVGCGAIGDASVGACGFIGELGLDGRLRPVPGALPLAEGIRAAGHTSVVVPAENGPEAAALDGLRVLSASTLADVVDHLRGQEELRPVEGPAWDDCTRAGDLDLGDVRGQAVAKRALEVAAAGGHNLILIGPPGAGKTMLARRLPGLLPPLEPEEAIEVTRVHSVAGLLEAGEPLKAVRPFRAPHHSVSEAGLVGGGSPLPRPGEVTLAHRGVLFLDELPEYRRSALESLRQPLEDGTVALFRAHGGVRYPADFVLVAAMNPCPCGFAGDEGRPCVCDASAIARYRGRISGPLLDRIDLHVPVRRVPVEALAGEGPPTPSSEEVGRRVREARARQSERLRSVGLRTNSQMTVKQISRFCGVDEGVGRFLERAIERLRLSARAYHRILRVARTIADLEGAETIEAHHAAEALQYRALDRGVGV